MSQIADTKVPRYGRTAASCLGLALGMVGLAYASVPLYDLFCKATGFAGTPMTAKAPSTTTGVRDIAVRFDANVSPALPWRFRPEASEITLRTGQTTEISYTIRNTGSAPTTGIASFNVQPELAAQYFNKLQCFCFTETNLAAGESQVVPVVFFIDPAIERDPDLRRLATITLSYTFFPVKGFNPDRPLASAASAIQPAAQ